MDTIINNLFQILRLSAVAIFVLLFLGIKLCHARVIDLHVHSDADNWHHENLERSNRDRDYDRYCEKESNGKDLSDKEKKEKESYERDNLN